MTSYSIEPILNTAKASCILLFSVTRSSLIRASSCYSINVTGKWLLLSPETKPFTLTTN